MPHWMRYDMVDGVTVDVGAFYSSKTLPKRTPLCFDLFGRNSERILTTAIPYFNLPFLDLLKTSPKSLTPVILLALLNTPTFRKAYPK